MGGEGHPDREDGSSDVHVRGPTRKLREEWGAGRGGGLKPPSASAGSPASRSGVPPPFPGTSTWTKDGGRVSVPGLIPRGEGLSRLPDTWAEKRHQRLSRDRGGAQQEGPADHVPPGPPGHGLPPAGGGSRCRGSGSTHVLFFINGAPLLSIRPLSGCQAVIYHPMVPTSPHPARPQVSQLRKREVDAAQVGAPGEARGPPPRACLSRWTLVPNEVLPVPLHTWGTTLKVCKGHKTWGRGQKGAEVRTSGWSHWGRAAFSCAASPIVSLHWLPAPAPWGESTWRGPWLDKDHASSPGPPVQGRNQAPFSAGVSRPWERSREKGVHADHLCERPQEGPPAHMPSPAGRFLIKETFSLKIPNRGEEVE